MKCGDFARRVHRSAEVTAVDRSDRLGSQRLRQLARLCQSALSERRVRLALPAALHVENRLAMPSQ
jgi:NADPH-dependent 2,4-dienoyl-CoA reductase/sulfur reductase-like enzyme